MEDGPDVESQNTSINLQAVEERPPSAVDSPKGKGKSKLARARHIRRSDSSGSDGSDPVIQDSINNMRAKAEESKSVTISDGSDHDDPHPFSVGSENECDEDVILSNKMTGIIIKGSAWCCCFMFCVVIYFWGSSLPGKINDAGQDKEMKTAVGLAHRPDVMACREGYIDHVDGNAWKDVWLNINKDGDFVSLEHGVLGDRKLGGDKTSVSCAHDKNGEQIAFMTSLTETTPDKEDYVEITLNPTKKHNEWIVFKWKFVLNEAGFEYRMNVMQVIIKFNKPGENKPTGLLKVLPKMSCNRVRSKIEKKITTNDILSTPDLKCSGNSNNATFSNTPWKAYDQIEIKWEEDTIKVIDIDGQPTNISDVAVGHRLERRLKKLFHYDRLTSLAYYSDKDAKNKIEIKNVQKGTTIYVQKNKDKRQTAESQRGFTQEILSSFESYASLESYFSLQDDSYSDSEQDDPKPVSDNPKPVTHKNDGVKYRKKKSKKGGKYYLEILIDTKWLKKQFSQEINQPNSGESWRAQFHRTDADDIKGSQHGVWSKAVRYDTTKGDYRGVDAWHISYFADTFGYLEFTDSTVPSRQDLIQKTNMLAIVEQAVMCKYYQYKSADRKKLDELVDVPPGCDVDPRIKFIIKDDKEKNEGWKITAKLLDETFESGSGDDDDGATLASATIDQDKSWSAEDATAEDGSAEDGSTKNGSTKHGSTEGGSTEGGSTEGGSTTS